MLDVCINHTCLFRGFAPAAPAGLPPQAWSWLGFVGFASSAATLYQFRSTVLGNLVAGQRHTIAAEWAKRQAYLALEVFLASAAAIGVDTCPIEGFDPNGYNANLGLPERGYTATVVATAGNRSANDHMASAAKVRSARAKVII